MIINLIVFSAGFAVMVFELVAARILSPYVGSSIYTWSGLISIIMLFMALGYWIGGKLADRRASLIGLSKILFWASFSIILLPLFKDYILIGVFQVIRKPQIAVIVDSLILFAIPSALMAMISPYSFKLKLHVLAHVGSTAGSLSAINTGGSIVGTFLAGYLLIPFLGINHILLGIGTLLFLLSALVRFDMFRIGILAVLLLLSGFHQEKFLDLPNSKTLTITDSLYNHIRVQVNNSGQPHEFKTLLTDYYGYQSSLFTRQPESLNHYMQLFRIADLYNPQIQTALMIGGGAYIFPMDYLQKHPFKSTIDVVEIDPAMTKIARDFFGLQTNSRLRIFHQDGRVYLASSQERYDVIYLDVYHTYFIPTHFLTREFAVLLKKSLKPNGLALFNVLSFPSRSHSLIEPIIKTLSQEFNSLKLYNAGSTANEFSKVSSYLVVVANFDLDSINLNNSDFESREMPIFLSKQTPIFTDDYVPSDSYVLNSLNEKFD